MHQYDDTATDTAGQQTAVAAARRPAPGASHGSAAAGYGGMSGLLGLAGLVGNSAMTRHATQHLQPAGNQSVPDPLSAATTTDDQRVMEPTDGPLAGWNKSVTAVAASRNAPPTAPVNPDSPTSALDDSDFNPTSRAHDLHRAVDSKEHTDEYVLVGEHAVEDVEAERRKIKFPAVVAALDGLTPSQVKRVEEVYDQFYKKTTLRKDLFEGGASGRKADLTPDQVGRLEALMRGTKADPLPPDVIDDLRRLPTVLAMDLHGALLQKADAAVALNRFQNEAIELHELLSKDLDETRRDRIMTLHRRPVAEISAVDGLYRKRYGEDALTADFGRRFPPDQLQTARLYHLRVGDVAMADGIAIEGKRRQIEASNAKRGASGVAKASASREADAEKRKLMGDIQKILELNKQEALADPANAGRTAGEAVAERLGKIMNLPHAEAGHTLGGELAKTLGEQDAASIFAMTTTDPWAARGSSNLVQAAAAQLAADERTGGAKAENVMETLRSFRELARQDLTAQAHNPAVSIEQKQAILRDGEGGVTTLAQQYINQYREAYNTIAAGKGRTYDQIVSSFGNADQKLTNFLSSSGGETSAWGELEHAVAKEDLDAAMAILRRQPNREKVDELISACNAASGGNLRQKLFTMAGGGRKAILVAEQLYKPTAAELAGPGSQAAQAKWITGAGRGEYDLTMMDAGIVGKLRELGDVPETQRLLVRSRDDLVALGKQVEAERDPAKREGLLAEMRKLRTALTGDAAAYEEDNNRVLSQIQSAVSFAVSIALAVAIPGAGAGVAAFLQTTAINIAGSVATNFVVKMGNYGLADLKADVFVGALGAGGAKLGQELLGRVVATVVKPAAEATAEAAGKAGVQASLSKEAGSLAAAGEKAAIKAEEVEARIAGRDAAEAVASAGGAAPTGPPPVRPAQAALPEPAPGTGMRISSTGPRPPNGLWDALDNHSIHPEQPGVVDGALKRGFEVAGPLVRGPVGAEGLRIGQPGLNVGDDTVVRIVGIDDQLDRAINAGMPIPEHLVGAADFVIINYNNVRGNAVDFADLGKAVRPGGRIIVWGYPAANPAIAGLANGPPPDGFLLAIREGFEKSGQMTTEAPVRVVFHKPIETAEQTGLRLGELARGKPSQFDFICGQLNRLQLEQADTVVAASLATLVTGREVTVVVHGADRVLTGIRVGPNQPILIVKPDGTIHRGTARITVSAHRDRDFDLFDVVELPPLLPGGMR